MSSQRPGQPTLDDMPHDPVSEMRRPNWQILTARVGERRGPLGALPSARERWSKPLERDKQPPLASPDITRMSLQRWPRCFPGSSDGFVGNLVTVTPQMGKRYPGELSRQLKCILEFKLLREPLTGRACRRVKGLGSVSSQEEKLALWKMAPKKKIMHKDGALWDSPLHVSHFPLHRRVTDEESQARRQMCLHQSSLITLWGHHLVAGKELWNLEHRTHFTDRRTRVVVGENLGRISQAQLFSAHQPQRHLSAKYGTPLPLYICVADTFP